VYAGGVRTGRTDADDVLLDMYAGWEWAVHIRTCLCASEVRTGCRCTIVVRLLPPSFSFAFLFCFLLAFFVCSSYRVCAQTAAWRPRRAPAPRAREQGATETSNSGDAEQASGAERSTTWRARRALFTNRRWLTERRRETGCDSGGRGGCGAERRTIGGVRRARRRGIWRGLARPGTRLTPFFISALVRTT